MQQEKNEIAVPTIFVGACATVVTASVLSDRLDVKSWTASRNKVAEPRPVSRVPPVAAIGDYALIGDCRTAALVSSTGSIDWLCFPNFAAASVFARLLDPKGGSFSICPTKPFSVTRRYLDGTAVLETTFVTSSGSARVLDCLPVLDGIHPMRPMREILRTIEGVDGEVTFCAFVDPRPIYARLRPKPKYRGKLGWSYAWGNEALYLRTDFDLTAGDDGLAGTFSVSSGQRRYASLSYTCGEPAVFPLLDADADQRLSDTEKWWQVWSSQIKYAGPYRAAVARSAITLKLLSYALSGAIVAAPTTSLPETIGGDRNWDYRYCWLRDAGLTMQAMVGIGIKDDAKAFLDWLLHATRLTWPKLQVMYDLYGRTELDECELPHLAGYGNSRPVRIGNGASTQQQLDIYGEVVLAAHTYVAAGGAIDDAGARMLAGLGKVVASTWREPDSGIWEVRGPPRQFTFSKVMCWTALDRLIELDQSGVVSIGSAAALFKKQRAAIAEVIERRGFSDRLAAYTSELDGDRVDTAMLLMPCVGYKKASDSRMQSTYALICKRLEQNGLLQRYEHDPDDHRRPEGAFGICSFWAIDQLAQRGQYIEAREKFDHLLSLANDLGLFAEEIDAKSGEALGNFPQAFTHVGLINAALAIEKAVQRAPKEGTRE